MVRKLHMCNTAWEYLAILCDTILYYTLIRVGGWKREILLFYRLLCEHAWTDRSQDGVWLMRRFLCDSVPSLWKRLACTQVKDEHGSQCYLPHVRLICSWAVALLTNMNFGKVSLSWRRQFFGYFVSDFASSNAHDFVDMQRWQEVAILIPSLSFILLLFSFFGNANMVSSVLSLLDVIKVLFLYNACGCAKNLCHCAVVPRLLPGALMLAATASFHAVSLWCRAPTLCTV